MGARVRAMLSVFGNATLSADVRCCSPSAVFQREKACGNSSPVHYRVSLQPNLMPCW
jgi:hypothetical protein